MEFSKEADLALESYTRDEKNEIKNGIKTTTLFFDSHEVIRTEILNELGKEQTGKEIGTYLTLVTGDAYKYSEEEHESLSFVLSSCLSFLISTLKPTPRKFLVVGLGNNEIVADSLGARVISQLVPSAHLKEENKELFNSFGYDLTLLEAGVTGQSGFDALTHIKAILSVVDVEAVILIDSLLTFDNQRLLKTIQTSNTGILPGSGGGKYTYEISKNTLSLPIISIGVPSTIKEKNLSKDTIYTTINSEISIEVLSKIIAKGINNVVKQYFSNIDNLSNIELNKNQGGENGQR